MAKNVEQDGQKGAVKSKSAGQPLRQGSPGAHLASIPVHDSHGPYRPNWPQGPQGESVAKLPKDARRPIAVRKGKP